VKNLIFHQFLKFTVFVKPYLIADNNVLPYSAIMDLLLLQVLGSKGRGSLKHHTAVLKDQ
jgi:hypothetical protein